VEHASARRRRTPVRRKSFTDARFSAPTIAAASSPLLSSLLLLLLRCQETWRLYNGRRLPSPSKSGDDRC